MAQKVRGMCRGVFSAGAHFLCGQKFGKPIRLGTLARLTWSKMAPALSQTGGLREPRTRIAPRWMPEISLLPLSLHQARYIIRLSSRDFSRAPAKGGALLNAHVARGRLCVATSTCALTAFSNDTSQRRAPNKPQDSGHAVSKIRDQTLDNCCITVSLRADQGTFQPRWSTRYVNLSCTTKEVQYTTCVPYVAICKTSFELRQMNVPAAIRAALPNFCTLRLPAEAPDWLPQYLPDSAEVTAASNWLVPTFQSIFSPPA
jgi:hypothetical protein